MSAILRIVLKNPLGRRGRKAVASAAAIMNLFAVWYRALGFNGCSSHSEQPGLITNAARKITTVGRSLRDVQLLAGHAW
jgi:hypothetical protein